MITANLDRVSDSDEEDGGTDPNTKSEVCWGLSRSSCNLAKELLTAQQLSVAESEENFLQLTKLESKSSQERDDKDEEKPADVSILAMFAQLDPFPLQPQRIDWERGEMHGLAGQTKKNAGYSIIVLVHAGGVSHTGRETRALVGGPRQEAKKATAQDSRRAPLYGVHG